jgi:Zn-finger nucleic acid-binding protein
MKCPACGNQLTEREVSDLTVDVCAGGCGGVWFDNHELRKLDEPHESAGEALLSIECDANVAVDHEQQRSCPRCEDMLMLRHFWSPARQVEVDECPGCGGHWLDEGELNQIRSLYDTEEERKQAAAEQFDEMFGDELEAMRAESQAKAEKARKIYNMFKFICPSYYLSK